MPSHPLSFHTLDVFTARRFAGNPLAVVLDADGLDAETMQAIAREFNLSETIFVMRPRDAANTAQVRIFFPNGEIPFAGHPTVGCAILLALRQQGLLDSPADGAVNSGLRDDAAAPPASTRQIRLEEVAGLVPVTVTGLPDRPRAEFTAPVIPVEVPTDALTVDMLARILGLHVDDIGFGGHRPRLHQAGPRCVHIPLRSRDALVRARALEPEWSTFFRSLQTDQGYLYAPGGDEPGTAFRARMFAPTAMVPEDPATGSATAMLAAQLLTSERLADGAHAWSIEQGYEAGRPSQLYLSVDVSAGALTAVRVAGEAVLVMQGTIRPGA